MTGNFTRNWGCCNEKELVGEIYSLGVVLVHLGPIAMGTLSEMGGGAEMKWSKAKSRQYNRKWRAKHPNYSRDMMRKYRGGLKGHENCGMRGCVIILGVRVRINGKVED